MFAPSDQDPAVDTKNSSWPMIFGTSPSGITKCWPLAVGLLDPSFWQSLGKAMESRSKISGYRDNLEKGWLVVWTWFIHHLAEGKSVEDFFEKLN